jgi:hypothetical protein
VDLADSADHGQMAVAVADVSLGAGDAGGQPLPMPLITTGDYQVQAPDGASEFSPSRVAPANPADRAHLAS